MIHIHLYICFRNPCPKSTQSRSDAPGSRKRGPDRYWREWSESQLPRNRDGEFPRRNRNFNVILPTVIFIQLALKGETGC